METKLQKEMKKIQLNRIHKTKNYKKHFALVDDADFELVSKYNWQIGTYGYAAGRNKERKAIAMHSLIMKTPKGKDTDHINGDKLDNRRQNLRITSRSKNLANISKKISNTSGFKGVSFDKNKITQKKGWQAQITKNYKNHNLGYFASPIEAALAYNRAAIKLFGNFARLNTI